jgi:ATP-dependent DNA helicase RecG
MRKTELLELIRRGENSELVFRPDTITNGAFAKEVAALLNLRGGRVTLGVEDDGSIWK